MKFFRAVFSIPLSIVAIITLLAVYVSVCKVDIVFVNDGTEIARQEGVSVFDTVSDPYSTDSSVGGVQTPVSIIPEREGFSNWRFSGDKNPAVKNTVFKADSINVKLKIAERLLANLFTFSWYDEAYTLIVEAEYKVFDLIDGEWDIEFLYTIDELKADSSLTSEDALLAKIVKYRGSAEGVVVPDFCSMDNGGVANITVIAADTFSGKLTGSDGTAYTVGDVSKVKRITFAGEDFGIISVGKGAFSGCNNLEKLTLSYVGEGLALDSDGRPTKTVGSDKLSHMFGGNIPESLHTVEVLGGSVGSWAIDAPELTTLIIGEDVKTVSQYAFAKCRKLTELVVAYVGADAGRGEKLHYFFDGAVPTSLATVEVLGGLLVDDAFDECRTVKNIYLNYGIGYIGTGAFDDCDVLSYIIDSGNGVAYLGTRNNKKVALVRATDTSIRSYAAPTELAFILDKSFYKCNSLGTLTVSDAVRSIGSYAFADCTALNTVTLNDASLVTVGVGVFNNCPIANAKVEKGLSYVGNEKNPYVMLVGSDSSLVEVSVNDATRFIVECGFEGSDQLKKLYVPKSVEYIAEATFRDCTAITTVTLPFVGVRYDGVGTTKLVHMFADSDTVAAPGILPASLTSITVLGARVDDGAFDGCSELKKVFLLSDVTYVGSAALSGCTGITELTLPFVGNGLSADVGGVKAESKFSHIFSGSVPASLTKLTVLGGKVKSRAFVGCSELRELILQSGVESVGSDALGGCTGLVKITLPYVGETIDAYKNNTFGYTYGSMSKVPSTLTHVTVLGGKKIGARAFENTSIVSLSLPSSLTIIDKYAFSGCSSLSEVAFAKDSELITIDDRAFNECVSLEHFSLPETVTTVGGYAFYGAGLVEIEFSGSVHTIGKYAFAECKKLETVAFNSTELKTIDNGAFSNCVKIDDVILPASLAKIGSSAFENLSLLTEIKIPANVEEIGSSAFEGCTAVALVEMDEDKSNLRKIGSRAFFGTDISSIFIPPCVNEIGESAFYECKKLESVRISDLNKWCEIDFKSENANPINDRKLFLDGKLVDGTITIDDVSKVSSYAFIGYKYITAVVVSADNIKTMGKSAFKDCTALESITLPFIGKQERYTYKTEVEFKEKIEPICSFGYIFGAPEYAENKKFVPNSLTKVVITRAIKVERYAFDECEYIERIDMPKVSEIARGVFKDCKNLSALVVNKNFVQIDDTVFSGCTKLDGVIFAD